MTVPFNISWVLIELGAAIIALAMLARLASRWGFSAIPLYLLAGLAFGNGGLIPLPFSGGFVRTGAEIGVILLLFMLGLEYSGAELVKHLSTGFATGLLDVLLNFPPGVIAGWLLGWSPIASLLLGGVTYISSTGVIAKVLTELGWQYNLETPAILSVLVLEDLAMVFFLPLVAVLLFGKGLEGALISLAVALSTVGAVLFVAVRYGKAMSEVISHQSDEITLLTTLGVVLLVAGLAQWQHVSAAVGAFLVGVALSGPLVERAHRLIGPLRDLFAAIFFLFFGLEIDPATLPPVLLIAAGLGLVTALTKLLTGWLAARRAGVAGSGRLRAGAALIARGEFSIVIAGLGMSAGLEPRIGPLAAAYVLIMAVAGPLLARAAGPPLALSEEESIQERFPPSDPSKVS